MSNFEFQLHIFLIVVRLDEIFLCVILHFCNGVDSCSFNMDYVFQTADWILFQFFLKLNENFIFIFARVRFTGYEYQISSSNILPFKIWDRNPCFFQNFETFIVFNIFADINKFVKSVYIFQTDLKVSSSLNSC